MTTPKETPEEHVHESVDRQEKAAQAVKATAKRVARKANDKASVLAVATEVLSGRVQTLADAVLMNSKQMIEFQKELNKKPDDEEVQFIAGLAKDERRRHLKYAAGTAVIASLISGYVAYDVANREGEMRCLTNSQNIETLVSIIDTPQLRNQYASQIADLRSNRNTCR